MIYVLVCMLYIYYIYTLHYVIRSEYCTKENFKFKGVFLKFNLKRVNTCRNGVFNKYIVVDYIIL